jgi:hypothetical protein
MAHASKITATARRTRVAANLISASPLPPAELAPALGVTPDHASNLMRNPETRAIAQSMLEPYRGRVMALVPKTLQRIEEALDAHMVVEGFETDKPDHAMRLRAADRLRRLAEVLDRGTLQRLQLGVGAETEPGQFRGTLEDLIVTYRQLTVTRQSD